MTQTELFNPILEMLKTIVMPDLSRVPFRKIELDKGSKIIAHVNLDADFYAYHTKEDLINHVQDFATRKVNKSLTFPHIREGRFGATFIWTLA